MRRWTAPLVCALSLLIAITIPATALAGTNDYPYRGSAPDQADQWGFFTRECTSFVAWRMVNNNGVGDFSNGMRGGHWGNAVEWSANASRLGFRVDTNPAVGAIAYWGAWQGGAYGAGHVSWVESVNGDGSANVEEYNFGTPFTYGTRTHVRAVSYIHVRDLGSAAPPPPTPVTIRVTDQPTPNQWYPNDISVSWHIDWGSCGSGTWNQEWDVGPAAPKWSSADGFTRFSYMGSTWPDGMHTHYVRWWACGQTGLVAMGPYGADRTPPTISALSFDSSSNTNGSTIWGPITIHGGMTDAGSGPASLRLDVLHDGSWDLARAGTLNAANGWTTIFDPSGIAPQDIRVHGWGSDNVGNSTNNFGALWLTLRAGPPPPTRPQLYSATYEALVVPTDMQVGVQSRATVGITNTSASTWPVGPTGVRVSYHWHGPTEIWDGVRGDIPALAPGARVQLVMLIDPPPTPGRYTLDIELVHETVTWFSWQGVPPSTNAVLVSAAPQAQQPATPGPVVAPVAPVAAPAPVTAPPGGGPALRPRPAPLAPASFALPAPNTFHASWVTQSAYPVAQPGALCEWSVSFRNTGSAPWLRGFIGTQANIGTAGPEDNDDANRLGMDPGNWLAPNRLTAQTSDVVGPGQDAWFVLQLRAPAQPGTYRIAVRPVIDGATWLEDYGVFLILTVAP